MNSMTSKIGFALFFCFAFSFVAIAKEPSPEQRVATVEKQVTSMGKILKKLLKGVARARQLNDVGRLNCLMVKLNLVKGLMKASERAKIVLMEAAYGGDAKVAATYAQKVNAYDSSVDEIESSISECTGVDASGEGTSIVYIQPEGETGLGATGGLSPFDFEDVDQPDDFPVVPPATPFR